MTEPISIDIWPGLAPGETMSSKGTRVPMFGRNVLTEVTHPYLDIYPVNEAKPAPTVLVLPGGGYEILADEHEGVEVAEWLNLFGFGAAILRYRVPKKRDAAFADAQRAMRVLRSRADEYNIDPSRLGVLGFSAGGHLSVRLATRYAFNGYILIDEADHNSARPDFAMPIYPAYLIGEDGIPPSEVSPHPDQPPLFLMQTADDDHFCVDTYADAARTAGVNVTPLVYEKGGHGYGLYPDNTLPVSDWPKEAEKWLYKVT